jgi:hypothetical protein
MKVTRYRGDTDADVFTVSKTDGSGAANLTGCALKMTLDTRANPTDASTQVYQLAGTIANPVTGVVSFTPTVDQSNKVGLFYFDIQLTTLEGTISTVLKGVYEFLQDITK